MVKQELVGKVSAETGHSRLDSLAVLESMLRHISKALHQGENVALRGFGTLFLKERAATKGFDIRRRLVVSIPPRAMVLFRACRELGMRVDQAYQSRIK